MEKILIYAAGAVGLGVGSCLIKAGASVDIIARQDTVLALRKYGLLRKGIFGEFKIKPDSFGAFFSLDDLDSKYDFILVCCKSFDTYTAAEDLYKHDYLINNNSTIVLFQNGWGNAEIFCKFFKKDLVYNARVITGFERKKPNEVNITVHADAIHIGSLFSADISRVKKLCKLISDGGIPSKATNSIEKDLWAKMLYNCLLNPLSAILRVPYGTLAENEATRNIMNNIAREIFMIMNDAGYSTHWESAEEYLKIFYEKLIPSTASHRSSMLQDIIKGKKTEIDALNGAIIKLATEKELNVPYNQTVYNMVKFLESKNKDKGASS